MATQNTWYSFRMVRPGNVIGESSLPCVKDLVASSVSVTSSAVHTKYGADPPSSAQVKVTMTDSSKDSTDTSSGAGGSGPKLMALVGSLVDVLGSRPLSVLRSVHVRSYEADGDTVKVKSLDSSCPMSDPLPVTVSPLSDTASQDT